MTKKTSESEGNKRYYASIAHEFMKGKGKRIKLTPNEKCLLGLIVYRSQHEGGIHFANQTICSVFGWQPNQLYRACNSLVAKGIIARDTSKAMYGKKGTEYTLLVEGNEAEEQPSEAPVQYQPILVQAPAEPPHVKPFHEQQTQQDGNEAITLLKQHLEALNKQQNEFLQQHFEALNRKMETLNKKVELLLNVINQRNKSSVSASKPLVDTLPTKEEIVDSTPTPHADLDHSDDEPPTPNEPFQSDYLMAIATEEAGGTIGGLTDTPIEPNERERLNQEARQRARKVKNNCEKNGMNPRDAALKAREAIEEEYGPKLGFDSVFQNLLSLLNSYAFGGSEELPF